MNTLLSENLLGTVLEVYLARARDEEVRNRKTASGGAVTALLIYALEKGIVEGVVAAKKTKGFEGQIVVAHDKKELLETVGNKWSIVPFAARMKTKIEEENLKKVALVCLPCQAQFFSQMRDFPLLETDFGERIKYIIGLFCIGTFAFEAFINYLRMKHGVKAEEIKDIVLKKDSLEVIYNNTNLLLPIEEVYSYLQTGCLVCTDYTGTWSDISAGFVESEPGWTVLIVRDSKARELIKGAEEEGYVEIREGSHVLGEVLKKAREKLTRAQQNMMYLL